jgi:hypothetical protein
MLGVRRLDWVGPFGLILRARGSASAPPGVRRLPRVPPRATPPFPNFPVLRPLPDLLRRLRTFPSSARRGTRTAAVIHGGSVHCLYEVSSAGVGRLARPP